METIKKYLLIAIRWGVFLSAAVDALQVIVNKLDEWDGKSAK